MRSSLAQAWLWFLVLGQGRGQMLEGKVGITSDAVRCTIDDLLPGGNTTNFRSGWSERLVDDLPYDCTCPFFKARYYCPHLGDTRYPTWEHPAVREGDCTVVPREDLVKEPLPPNSKVLLYGNSYLRQVVQGIMCMFPHAVDSRRVTYPSHGERRNDFIEPDVQCRACYVDLGGATLTENSCLDAGIITKACSCKDDTGEFNFKNGAKLHYYFAHDQLNKTVDAALEVHGTSYKDYDIVFANPGNEPRMHPSSVLESAQTLKEEGIPFAWLSYYKGLGAPEEYFLGEGELEDFWGLGIKFLPVHEMMKEVTRFNRGSVEGGIDSHFCLPGPSNELSLFVLQVVWAAWARQ